MLQKIVSLNFATVCGPLDMYLKLGTGQIRAIFTKGDPLSCKNYRPISLISAGYNLFAVALLNRLKDAGAESRLSST